MTTTTTMILMVKAVRLNFCFCWLRCSLDGFGFIVFHHEIVALI